MLHRRGRRRHDATDRCYKKRLNNDAYSTIPTILEWKQYALAHYSACIHYVYMIARHPVTTRTVQVYDSAQDLDRKRAAYVQNGRVLHVISASSRFVTQSCRPSIAEPSAEQVSLQTTHRERNTRIKLLLQKDVFAIMRLINIQACVNLSPDNAHLLLTHSTHPHHSDNTRHPPCVSLFSLLSSSPAPPSQPGYH